MLKEKQALFEFWGFEYQDMITGKKYLCLIN